MSKDLLISDPERSGVNVFQHKLLRFLGSNISIRLQTVDAKLLQTNLIYYPSDNYSLFHFPAVYPIIYSISMFRLIFIVPLYHNKYYLF